MSVYDPLQNRIDRIDLCISVATNFEGIKDIKISIDVTDQNTPFVQAVIKAWQEHYDKEVAALASSSAPQQQFPFLG